MWTFMLNISKMDPNIFKNQNQEKQSRSIDDFFDKFMERFENKIKKDEKIAENDDVLMSDEKMDGKEYLKKKKIL
jgi:hypothetical protein